MISDILSDAAAQIQEYLNGDIYKDMDARTGLLIYTALDAMKKARIHLDTPPNDAALDKLGQAISDNTIAIG